MRLGDFIDRRAQAITRRKILKGKDDFPLPYEILLSGEGLRGLHNLVTQKMGEEAIKGFLYTIRSYGKSDEPSRVHVSHRGDKLTTISGAPPHPEYGAPLKQKPDSPNYIYKILIPDLIADQYDPNELTQIKDSDDE